MICRSQPGRSVKKIEIVSLLGKFLAEVERQFSDREFDVTKTFAGSGVRRYYSVYECGLGLILTEDVCGTVVAHVNPAGDDEEHAPYTSWIGDRTSVEMFDFAGSLEAGVEITRRPSDNNIFQIWTVEDGIRIIYKGRLPGSELESVMFSRVPSSQGES